MADEADADGRTSAYVCEADEYVYEADEYIEYIRYIRRRTTILQCVWRDLPDTPYLATKLPKSQTVRFCILACSSRYGIIVGR